MPFSAGFSQLFRECLSVKRFREEKDVLSWCFADKSASTLMWQCFAVLDWCQSRWIDQRPRTFSSCSSMLSYWPLTFMWCSGDVSSVATSKLGSSALRFFSSFFSYEDKTGCITNWRVSIFQALLKCALNAIPSCPSFPFSSLSVCLSCVASFCPRSLSTHQQLRGQYPPCDESGQAALRLHAVVCNPQWNAEIQPFPTVFEAILHRTRLWLLPRTRCPPKNLNLERCLPKLLISKAFRRLHHLFDKTAERPPTYSSRLMSASCVWGSSTETAATSSLLSDTSAPWQPTYRSKKFLPKSCADPGSPNIFLAHRQRKQEGFALKASGFTTPTWPTAKNLQPHWIAMVTNHWGREPRKIISNQWAEKCNGDSPPPRWVTKPSRHHNFQLRICCTERECPWHRVASWVASVCSSPTFRFHGKWRGRGSYRFLSSYWQNIFLSKTPTFNFSLILWPGGGGHTGFFLRGSYRFLAQRLHRFLSQESHRFLSWGHTGFFLRGSHKFLSQGSPTFPWLCDLHNFSTTWWKWGGGTQVFFWGWPNFSMR